MPEVSVLSVASQTYTDPDELEESFNQRRNVRVVQLTPHPFQCEILGLDLGLAQMLFITLNTPIRILGDKTPNWLDFCVVMPPTPGALISHGLPLKYDTVFGFNNTCEIDMVLPENLVFASLQVKREVIEDLLQIMDRSDLDDRFFATNYVQSPGGFSPIQQYLREVYKLVNRRSTFLDQPQISTLFLEDYLPLLIGSIPARQSSSQVANYSRSRSELVRQAEEYMLANLDQPMTLKALCTALNTTKSPLSYGFQEIFGVSPMAYLKLLRLQAVHKSLKIADPTTKIVDIAHQFGFWHLGRFSQDYKQTFGQLPSMTMQKGA